MKIFIVNENIQGKFSVTISYRDFRKYFLILKNHSEDSMKT